MKLERVEIRNYRAIERLDLALDPDLTVFHGNNGHGKTSVLSGIVVGLAPPTSRRRRRRSRDRARDRGRRNRAAGPRAADRGAGAPLRAASAPPRPGRHRVRDPATSGARHPARAETDPQRASFRTSAAVFG